MDLKRGAKAIEELEANASKLSDLIPELSKVKTTLEGLRKAETSSQKKLKEFEKTISTLESQLTESLQLKLAEGLAEVSSRTKDIYDVTLTEQSKNNLALEKINSQLASINNHIKKLEDENQNLKAYFSKLIIFSLLMLIALLLSEWRHLIPIN